MDKVKVNDDLFILATNKEGLPIVIYIAGGNNGGVIHYNDYCIHPMAFVGVKWDMNECDDSYIRPFVCDTTVSHHAVDEHNSRYDAIIEPWVENKVLE